MPANTSTRSARSTSKTSSADLKFEDVPSPISAGPHRTQRAREYESKVEGLLNLAMRACVGSPATVADGAAIIEYGPALASKAGDLADADARVRRALDLITSGTDNPYLALAFAAMPLVAQIARNHETSAEVTGSRRIEFRIPFTKGKKTLGFNVRFKLRNPLLRSMTVEPTYLNSHVFGNSEIGPELTRQGVNVAWSPNGKAR